jgi:hypothetical protein
LVIIGQPDAIALAMQVLQSVGVQDRSSGGKSVGAEAPAKPQ